MIPPPILWMKSFDIRVFLKPGRVPLRNFSVLRNKTLSTENRDTRLPLLSLTFFDTRKFLKNRRFHLRSFRYCETTNFRRKVVVSLLSLRFLDTRNFLKHRRIPLRIFWHCETKIFQWEIVILFCIKYRNHWWNFVFNRLRKLIKMFVVGRKICHC